MKVKWDKKADRLYTHPNFNECIDGNCADGEGVRLYTEKLQPNYDSYFLYGAILKGKFTEGGKRFTGKVYQFKLPAGGFKNEKELRIGTPLDMTNDAAMKAFYVGEGTCYLGNDGKSTGWYGEVKDLPALSKIFPDAKLHTANFKNGSINWIDVDLPARHRFIRYTGHVFPSGDFIFGKALLDNGDLYEGFFLRNSFHGPGKLTKRSGKISQGIWQVDSLTQDVPVVFPEALLKATLPTPTTFTISELNGMDINSFKHSPTQINIFEDAEFYGDVVNNEASGWGLWKARFTKGNADARDDVAVWAYGYWKHNQLDGPGIYFANAIHSEFWINTGVYKGGKIVKGNTLYADYSLLGNTPSFSEGFPILSTYSLRLKTNPLQGCGMYMDFGYSRGYEARPSLNKIIEGYYTNETLTGFYFENDKEKKRSYEFLNFAGYNKWNFTEANIKAAEASNDFCFDAISRYKPLFIAEMKKKLEGNIAAEAWAKSPEGLAHKQRVEVENRQYEEKRKKDCDAEFAKIGVKGRTYMYQASYVILEGYDCNKKEYIAWRPRQGNDLYSAPAMTQIRGLAGLEFYKLTPSVKQYRTCGECNGTGKVIVTTTTTRTKELPFGYFSGIETKSIRTTTKEEAKTCTVCNGLAIVLK